MLKIREIYIRWIGIPVLAGVVILITGKGHEETWLGKYLVALVFTFLFWNGAFMLFIYFRRRFPLIRQTPRRLLITFLALSLFLLTADAVGCAFLHGMTLPELYQAGLLFEYAPINFSLALVVGSLYENVYFFENWKSSFQLNEQLKNQQIRTQFEVLQNQMSPHFLFNSLNTLTTLIAENQNTAIDFTQKLSDVYRYILQNKERELVPLADELAFARDYLFLLKMRYPDNLIAEFRVDKTHHTTSIAPLTIQMLIENAIKHNVVSKAHPLRIEIYVENGHSIVVKNNLQQKNVIEKSTKTGLINIQKRYEYLGNRKIDIIMTPNNYLVAIPLIRLTEEHHMKIA